MSTKTLVHSKMYENTLDYKNSLIHAIVMRWNASLLPGDLPLTVPNATIELSIVKTLNGFALIPSRAVVESTTVHMKIHVVTTTYGP